MTSRERLFKAIRHEMLDRVPFTYQGTKETNDKLITYFQKKDIDDVLKIFKVDKFGSLSEGLGKGYMGS